jgi:hypothetical protein
MTFPLAMRIAKHHMPAAELSNWKDVEEVDAQPSNNFRVGLRRRLLYLLLCEKDRSPPTATGAGTAGLRRAEVRSGDMAIWPC